MSDNFSSTDVGNGLKRAHGVSNEGSEEAQNGEIILASDKQNVSGTDNATVAETIAESSGGFTAEHGDTERRGSKTKLRRLRGEEYNVAKAREYFESEDFKQLGHRVSVDKTSDLMEEGDARHGAEDEVDSDVSLYSDDDADDPAYADRRRGSYDFVDIADYDNHVDNDDDGVSVELEEGDSEFESENECSSISVSDSDSEMEGDDHSHVIETSIRDGKSTEHSENDLSEKTPGLSADVNSSLSPSNGHSPDSSSTSHDVSAGAREEPVNKRSSLTLALQLSQPARKIKRIISQDNPALSPDTMDVIEIANTDLQSSDTKSTEADIATGNSDYKPARPLVLFDPSLAPAAQRKKRIASESKPDEPPPKSVISPDIIDGYSLSLGWVDRVNKILAEKSENRTLKSNADLIKDARECKIMKRYSEKVGSTLDRPVYLTEKLRRSPSDNFFNRSPHLPRSNRNPNIGFSHDVKPRTASYKLACINPHEQDENHTNLADATETDTPFPTSDQGQIEPVKVAMTSNSPDLATFGTTADSSERSVSSGQLIKPKPRIPRRSLPVVLPNTMPSGDNKGEGDNAVVVDSGFQFGSQVKVNDSGQMSDTHDQLSPSAESSRSDKTSEASSPDSHEEMGNVLVNQDAGELDTGVTVRSSDIYPHGLTRKPAVRRKGYAWASKSLPKNTSSDVKRSRQHRELTAEGSSLDLAPSLLNLYDHRIAAGGNNKSSDDDDEDDTLPDASVVTVVTKSQSLPTSSGGVTSTSPRRIGQLPGQKLPSDRPMSMMDNVTSQLKPSSAVADSKKRPLSISSMSSVSSSSLPRLRKKRAGPTPSESSLTSDTTITPRDTTFLVSHSRQSVDSGCVEGTNGDKYFDNMSITSSDTGSFRDEVDSNSMRDYSLMSSSPSDKSQILTSSQSQRSNSGNSPFPSPDSKAREPKNNSITSTSSGSPRPTRTSSLRRPQFPPSDSGLGPNKPYKYHQLSAVHTSSDSRSKDAVSSPDITRRSFQANARQEARKRFFSNYEEHLNQSANVDPDSLEHSSPSQTRSHRSFHGTGQHKTSSPSSPTATAARTSPASSSPSATAANGERRRENSSQISFTSEKATARRAERKSMSGKHDGGPPMAAPTASPASQKYAFSRASKKKDGLGSSDPANKSSPVYVSYVQRVVTEIIESERTYIASLKDIIEGYLEPLAKLLSSPDAKEFVVCLFSNIREIYSFGCAFLEDLEQTGADPVKVAKCFVRHNKGFVIYTDYCTNYPRAVEVLTSFMQHPELSELFRERQMALGHGLPLGAYLLRPVQRILKYHLLLQNIVKHYEKEGGEAEVLKQAFHHMTQMAHHINEMKRKHEHAVRIQEIQSQLEDYVGDDLTRLGELVLESTFRVYGAKASRQVFLFERGLLISKKKEGGMLSFKTLIKCSNLMLVEVIPNEPFSFHVIPFDNPRAQYTLQARNMELKRKWCQEIKRLILESFKGRIPDNVKNLVMQLGREHDDDYVPKEALEATRKNQHTAPEYLEKRRFRRKSGSRMPDFSLLKPQRVRRGGNKKGENKSGDKSPDRGRGGRRAESKSPEAHRRLFSRQNNMAKRRAQSHSTSLPNTPNNDMSYPELFNQSKSDSKKPISQPVTPDPKEIKFDSPSSSTNTTPENSAQITLRRSLIRSLSESDDGGKEPGGMKRPASFLMARARPICSEDLTELVVRCGGSVKMASHAEALEEGEEIQHFSALSDSPSNPSDHSLRRRSAVDDSSEVDDDDDDDDDTVAGDEGPDESVSVSEDMITDYIDGTEESHSKSCDPQPVSSETNTSLQEQMTSERSEDQMKTESRSSSLPILSQTDKDLNEAGGDVENSDMTAATKATSQSSDSVYDKANMPKPRGRLSRRDLQNVAYANGHNVRKKGKTTNRAESPAQESKEGIKVSAFHDTYSKRTAEKAVLRKKGLRLPNTSKHLSVQDSLSSTAHPSGVKAKLTNWNSVDKLTKGSMTDLSHVNEDPWVMNPEVTGSRTSVDEEVADRAWPPSCGSHGHPPAYPRSQSDLTEIAQVSTNKENLDWLVYLNRNYKTSPTHLSSNPPQKLSSPLSSGKDNYNSMKQISSQVPYATPPRSYMTTENMKKLGSSDNSLLTRASFQRPSSRDSTSSSVNAFGSPSMTVTLTKPVSFSAVQLSRSNSSPVTNRHTLVLGGRNRPVSMDMETLTDESNRMVAEMEEYINKTSSPDNIKSPNKFPTSLPTITVEDDSVDCNRLSMVSSISTSSYESQGSSSSDGLVGTLKHKLHSWAQGSRSRNDSEFSQASTLTSDEEDEEETPTHATSGNTFEPPSSTRNLWKEDRDLETVLREHSLGSSKLGSRMAHAYPIQSEIVVSHHSADTPVHEGRPHSTCGLTAVENASQLTEKTCAVKENLPDQARFSLPPTTEATEALMPKALKNCEIQQSDSGFSLQSNDSTLSDQNQVTYKSRSEAVLELSEESSREVTPKVKPKVSKSQPPQVPNADLKRNDSCESIDSTDSFYERKLSLAFDSDIFQEKPATFSITEEHQPQGQVEIPPPRKSIREYVHAFEEKCRSQSPKVFEIKRREPGAMIRQRLETLQESLKYGSRSSSNHSSRPVSEERESLRSRSQPPSQQHSSLNFHPTLNNKMNEDIRVNCLKTSRSRDSLSKSAENLSRSRENLFSRSRENLLSRSRDNVFLSKSKENLYSGGSWSKASSPSFTVNFNRAGHEKDANRFHYIMAERSDNLSNNQFIHRARSNSDQPPQEAERSSTPGAEGETLQSSKSLCHIDQMSSEVDNLVIMKGWVRALIAKFQDS